MKIAIVTNVKIKNHQKLDKKILDELAKKYQFTYELHICKPDALETTLKKLMIRPFNVFLIAGGDGTVRNAAQILVDADIPLAVLPLGTFNHFAKQLGLPQDLEELIKIIKQNKIQSVDVAEVNKIIFINNSSIGFYSHVLKLKEKYKYLFPQSKIFKMIFTAINIFHVIPVHHLKMEIDNKEVSYDTCLVFIGNNYYYTNPTDLGGRSSLTSGFLSVYILKCQTRFEIIRCFISMIFNTFDKNRYLAKYITNSLTITSQSKNINVIVDGELLKLESPLNYLIHAKKLRVITP